jgi:hypothetical protein
MTTKDSQDLPQRKFEYQAFITELERIEADEVTKCTHGLHVGDYLTRADAQKHELT